MVLLFILAVPPKITGQIRSDTTMHLEEVKVNAYFTELDILRVTASAGVVSRNVLDQQSGTTLLPAINTVPGVRMEERSPGSYRLSIRGSLLRSPFGVRNVKIYLDEIPLTDAGGNTYLNSLDAGSMEGVEVLKGPDGSLFGANSGGVVLLRPEGMAPSAGDRAYLRLNGGSYGLFHQQASASFRPSANYRFTVNQAYQQTDGYRENSAMRRTFFQTVQRWNYRKNSEVRLLALYSDMHYSTPGGLTEAQFAENPRSARLATAVIPGAVEQQAGIYNKTFVGGLVHDMRLSDKLRHVVSVFGSDTDFRNPFITNYEFRDEHNYGFRTHLDYEDSIGAGFSWRANAGMEWQRGQVDISNYDNQRGERGEPQAADILRNGQHFYFVRFSADVWNKLSFETSLSLNYYRYAFRGVYPVEETAFSRRRFDPEWMPRAGVSYLLNPQVAWRASVSKGYSPPTTAEVRSSDNIVNTVLEAETGWNYETGIRWQARNRRFFVDASVFYYHMDDAIIRQLRENGAEFFSNAGGVEQRGLELAVSAWALEPGSHNWIGGIQLGSNLTLSRFRFADYQIGGDDYSGNKLTGVPAEVLVSHIRFLLPRRINAYVMHNYTSSIPLDDANSFYADAYHLLQAKVNWDIPLNKMWSIQVFAGADNLLNQTYSLGNDINAFGGRFFNAAAGRNFYGGLLISY